MPKISVIVPVYNVENYLKECLDSLISQTLNDFEIICINDGSTDSSPDILKEYEVKDDRIRIISQENGGLSKSRNVGLDNASGEYVYFMDSDDILRPYALKNLYNLAKGKDLDLIIFKLINFYDESGEKFKSNYYDMKFLKEAVGENVFSHRDLDSNSIFRIAVSAPGKLFKRELISDLRFPEGLLFEDNPFFIEYLFKSERVYFYDSYLYERRIREDSITTSSDNEAFMDYIKISEMLIDITKRYGLYDEYRLGLYSKTINNIFFRFTLVGDDIKDEFFQKIKKDFSAKSDEYSNDEKFKEAPERVRKIFYDGINSQTYREYELSVNVFDIEAEIEKQHDRYETRISNLKSKNAKLKDDVSEKRKKIKSLNNEIATNKKEIKKLNSKIDKLSKRNESLKSINDELMTSTSWKVTKPLRKVGSFVKRQN